MKRRDQLSARLALRKQTLRQLSGRDLARVAGGTVYFDDGGSGGSYDPPPPADSNTQGPGGWSGCCNCG